MTATVETFRATFPAFKNETNFPDGLVNFYLQLANLMLPAQRWGQLIDYGSQLFAAHHLAIEEQAQQEAARGGVPGQRTGILSSRSAGPVSYSLDTSSAAEAGAGFWNTTMYGLRFYRMIRMIGMGGLQLGAPAMPCIVRISNEQRTALIGFCGLPIFGASAAQSIPPAPKPDENFKSSARIGGG